MIEVIRTSGSPQATTHSKGCRSLSTLTAKPCVVTSRATCTPIEAILRSPSQTPVKSRPSRGRARGAGHALVGERGDDRLLHRAHVGDDVADAHDRVADELARARGR